MPRPDRSAPTRHGFTAGIILVFATTLGRAGAPGGFLEPASTQTVRPRPTSAQIAALPSRGPFTFGAPYLTQASRVTTGADCGGSDCVIPVGYSYWRNMNNHTGRSTILMFLGLSTTQGGTGPTLFEYDKTSGAVSNRGPLFDASSPFHYATAEGWYFSGTRPTTLYMLDGSKLRRYDVLSHAMETVFDSATQYRAGTYIWQPHSSDDDRVHSVTLRDSATYAMTGCLVYREDSRSFSYFPARGAFDECSVDKSGHWLVILDNVDNRYGVDNRIINLDTGSETVLMDENGAAGHCDVGQGYLVGEDDWASDPGTARLWRFDQPLVPSATQGVEVYHTTSWSADLGHLSHGNARAGIAPGQQYACSSNATRLDLPRSNEIVCYRLDGSLQVLVVAPVMTNLDATGGGSDDYSKRPKGNLDVTGEYFVWTTNLSGNRLDAFIVHVPSQLLVAPSSDTTPPTVAVTSPSNAASVTGRVGVSASASDASGVAGVQFRLDGVALGQEATTAPYQVSWDTATASAGAHTLTAVARDASGNTATSVPVAVTVSLQDTTPPVLSAIGTTGIGTVAATIDWTSDEAADSQVDYGPSTAYGASTVRDGTLLLAHAQALTGLSTATTYHYRVRSRDGAGNPSVSTDRTFVTAAAGGTGGATWTNLVSCSASGGTLRKTAGVDGADDARAVTQQQLVAGDGAIEFGTTDVTTIRFAGLSIGAGGAGWSSIDFAVRLGPWNATTGVAEVRERGVWRADTTYVVGDRFRVAVQAGVVRYFKNGAAFHTSTVAPSYPLRGDAAIFSVGAQIADASFTVTPPGRPAEVSGVRAAASTFTWNAVPSALSYHAYRGRLSALRNGSWATCEDVLDVNRIDTSFTDTQVPPTGGGYFYLFTAVSSAGEGTMGDAATGERVNTAACF